VHKKQVRRRRAVLALLVAVSLILLTAYFGESPSSPLHSVQRGIAEVFSPIQEGASKVLSPVRDIAGWFSDTLNAKSQRDALRKRVNQLLAQNATLKSQAIDDAQLRKQVGLDDSIGISRYKPVAASVIGRDPTVWYVSVEIDKGSSDGIKPDDPVLAEGALVGKVSTVAGNVSFVTLLTDHTFAVAAKVLDQKGDTGELVPKIGNPNQLLLQYLQPPPPGQPGPAYNDIVVTAGFSDPHNPAYGSLYPPNIPIGTVSDANQNQLQNNGQVQVSPTADLRHFDSVQVLTGTNAGTLRAQVSGG
jgi:rod shape-determining protein MreC